MVILWILVAIIIFSVIVLVHEYGHFKSARIFWVKVIEFWLWIPPRAKNLFTDKKWTLFTLNWLPIWWFVRLKWEMVNRFELYDINKNLYNNDNLEKDIKAKKEIYSEGNSSKDLTKLSDEEKEEVLEKLLENKSSDNLNNKPIWQQSIVILAWIFMNFILAIVIFSIIFFIWFKPLWVISNENPQTNVLPTYDQAIKNWFLIKKEWILMFPLTWSIAQTSWINEWDLLKSINWIQLKTPEDAMKLIWSNKLNKINMSVCDKISKCKIIEVTPSIDWKIGSYLQENVEVNKDFIYKYPFFESIKYWTIETYNEINLTFYALKKLWKSIFAPKDEKERETAIQSMSWPIWIVDFISKSIWEWIIFLLIITAVISINLWVFNLLPIPALDWWRFFLIIINWLVKAIFWRKFIGETFEWLIHLLFFVILIALSLLIWYNDVTKIFQ